jgi:hypothetical protein
MTKEISESGKQIIFQSGQTTVDYLEIAAPPHKKKKHYRVHVMKDFEGSTWVVDHRPSKKNAERLIKKTF